MPIYVYRCDGCGPFEERRSFEEAGEAAACPECGAAARRVYTMPNTKRVPAGLSTAMDRAEKSAHEPEVARRPAGRSGTGHRHGHGGRPWTIGH